MHQLKIIVTSFAVFLLAACSNDEFKEKKNAGGDSSSVTIPGDNSSGSGSVELFPSMVYEKVKAYSAAIVTVDPSYQGGALQLAKMDYDAGKLTLTPEVISKTKSDYTVSAFGDHFYHIGRFQIDSIYKYAFSNPGTQLYQGDFAEGYDLLHSENDANAYEIVFVNDTKAYMVRYGSTKAWIINPSATNEADFKLGELDLAAYDDGDGVPEMKAAKIVGDKLFIVMERLKNWCPEEPSAYVAVFDTKTDTEIDVNSANDPNGFKGIELEIRNPSTIDYDQDIGLIIAGVGAGTIFSCTPANRYSGGIEIIHPGNYQTTLLIDDGDEANHPYDFISGARVLDKNNGYFTSYVAWGETKLYHFNPSTGAVTGVVPGFGDSGNIDIRVLAKAPDNILWVGAAQDLSSPGSSPEMFVVDAKQNQLGKLSLERDPEAIAFTINKQDANPFASVQPPFAPVAGQTGSTAIADIDSNIVAWATGFENYQPGTDVWETWKTPEQALGIPGDSDGSNKGYIYDIVSLGRGGEITLTFDKPITNGQGADFAVFENSFDHQFLELAWVEVSSDGINFFRFPNFSFTENPVGGFGYVQAEKIKGLAGKYQGGFGTPFDLEELKAIEGLDVNAITHVKVIDIVGNGTAVDSLGQVIYEPYPTVQSSGFDLDAVGVMHQK